MGKVGRTIVYNGYTVRHMLLVLDVDGCVDRQFRVACGHRSTENVEILIIRVDLPLQIGGLAQN